MLSREPSALFDAPLLCTAFVNDAAAAVCRAVDCIQYLERCSRFAGCFSVPAVVPQKEQVRIVAPHLKTGACAGADNAAECLAVDKAVYKKSPPIDRRAKNCNSACNGSAHSYDEVR